MSAPEPALQLLVLADDRTGALETAGACADAGLSSIVTSGHAVSGTALPPHTCRVVDLATRHLDPADAARCVADAVATSKRGRDTPKAVRDARGAVDTQPARAARAAHKIDSTLRGNWAVELVERYRVSGRRTMVVAAFPAAGRTCAGGVVHEHGTPVAQSAAGRDPLQRVVSSSPADHLHAADAGGVAEVAGDAALARWFASELPFAVCDAESDAELVLLAERWAAQTDVVLAGTAAAIGAAARVVATGAELEQRPPPPRIRGPALVVCGSLHPVARAQIEQLRRAGARHTILVPPDRDTDAHVIDPADARRAAQTLATAARRELDRGIHGALVVVGGDTAAEVLGDAPLLVGGTAAVGVPWCSSLDGSGPITLTKPGGFGDADTLVRLLEAILDP